MHRLNAAAAMQRRGSIDLIRFFYYNVICEKPVERVDRLFLSRLKVLSGIILAKAGT